MGRLALSHLEHASRALDKAKASLDEGRLFTDTEVAQLKELQEEVVKLRDKFIYFAVLGGSKAKDVATVFKLSPGRVSQIVKKVKMELEE